MYFLQLFFNFYYIFLIFYESNQIFLYYRVFVCNVNYLLIKLLLLLLLSIYSLRNLIFQ